MIMPFNFGMKKTPKAIVPMTFRLPEQPEFSIDFVIDIGIISELTQNPISVPSVRKLTRDEIY